MKTKCISDVHSYKFQVIPGKTPKRVMVSDFYLDLTVTALLSSLGIFSFGWFVQKNFKNYKVVWAIHLLGKVNI